MSRIWIVRTGAAILVLTAGAWIARNTYWEETEVETQPKTEALQNPYYALEHFLRALGISTQVAATLQTPPKKSGALFVGNVQMDLLRRRIATLEPWVAAGGHLIVGGTTIWLDADLQKWSGVSPSIRFVTKDKDDDKVDTRVAGRRPLIECNPLALARNGLPTGEVLSLCAFPDEFAFKSNQTPEWSASNEYGIQSLRLNIGLGSLTILPRALVAGNSNIRKGDHAKLIFAASGMQRGDTAWLYLPSRSEKLLAMLWRIAAPGIVVLLIALALMIGRQMPRFGTPLPAPLPLRRSLAEQIRAQAAFAWRTRRLGSLRKAARRALDESGGRLIGSYRRLDTRQRASSLAAAAGMDARALGAAMTGDAAGDPRMQRSAIALLQLTRRALLQSLKKVETQHDC